MNKDDLVTLDQRKAYGLVYGERKRKNPYLFGRGVAYDDENDAGKDAGSTAKREDPCEKKQTEHWVEEQAPDENKIVLPSDNVVDEKVSERVKLSFSIPLPKPPKDLEDIASWPGIDPGLRLHDVYTYFKQPMEHPDGGFVRIVGEDHLGVCLSLILCENGSFGIEGPPGSSKTLHMNRMIDLLPKDKVYIASQVTENGIFEDCDAINGLDYLLFTELQKVVINQRGRSGRLMEALKDLMEGRPARLKKTVGNQVVTKTLQPIPIGYCRSATNPYDGDAEFKRRVTTFFTTSGVSEREEINRSRYQDMHKIWNDEGLSGRLGERLRDHITAARRNEALLFDPYSDLLGEIIPVTRNSTSYLQHYYHMVSGSARFNITRRETAAFGERTYVFASIEDHWTAYQSYHHQFIANLRNSTASDEQGLFDTLLQPDWERWQGAGLEFLREHPDAEPVRKGAPWVIRRYIEETPLVHDYLTGKEILLGGRG